jgi:hypothetical protein
MIAAICPAIAPITIPKFRPSPATIGRMSERIRNELRPKRVRISLAR